MVIEIEQEIKQFATAVRANIIYVVVDLRTREISSLTLSVEVEGGEPGEGK